MAQRIRLRRGTAALWASTNPVLAAGELGVETDTGKVKVGDGTTAWTGLTYLGAEAAGSVTTAAIADGAVTAAKVAADVATQAELDANTASAALIKRRTATTPPRIVTLIGGQDDEAPTAVTCTIAADTTNFKVGSRGWKMTVTGAVNAQLRLNPPGTENPLVMGPASAVGLWIWLADASLITSVVVDLFSPSATWSQSKSTGLATGWNFIRWTAASGTLTGWGTLSWLRVSINTTAATNATVGHLWVERPPKAQIIVVADGAQSTFYTEAYPALKALGIPVTFAINPNLLGTTDRMTEAEVAIVAAENENSIGFHSWASEVTASMTAEQIRADTMKSIKWLEARGYTAGRLWRAAWTQNSATNHAAAQGLVLAYSSPSNQSGTPVACWPPTDRWNIPRWSLHGRTTADMDTAFTNLQNTRGFMNCYTHGVKAAGGNDITPTMWAYFLDKVTAGVNAGWLEGFTFGQLFAESGGKVRQTFGDTTVEFFDEVGVRQTARLP